MSSNIGNSGTSIYGTNELDEVLNDILEGGELGEVVVTNALTIKGTSGTGAYDITNSTNTTATFDLPTIAEDINSKIELTEKGQALGVVPLDAGSKIDSIYLPNNALTSVVIVANIVARDLLINYQSGDVCTVLDSFGETGFNLPHTYIFDGSFWIPCKSIDTDKIRITGDQDLTIEKDTPKIVLNDTGLNDKNYIEFQSAGFNAGYLGHNDTTGGWNGLGLITNDGIISIMATNDTTPVGLQIDAFQNKVQCNVNIKLEKDTPKIILNDTGINDRNYIEFQGGGFNTGYLGKNDTDWNGLGLITNDGIISIKTNNDTTPFGMQINAFQNKIIMDGNIDMIENDLQNVKKITTRTVDFPDSLVPVTQILNVNDAPVTVLITGVDSSIFSNDGAEAWVEGTHLFDSNNTTVYEFTIDVSINAVFGIVAEGNGNYPRLSDLRTVDLSTVGSEQYVYASGFENELDVWTLDGIVQSNIGTTSNGSKFRLTVASNILSLEQDFAGVWSHIGTDIPINQIGNFRIAVGDSSNNPANSLYDTSVISVVGTGTIVQTGLPKFIMNSEVNTTVFGYDALPASLTFHPNQDIDTGGLVNGRNIATDGMNLDTHLSDNTVHFSEGSISHLNITNIGTNTHDDIDTHISDASIHFTQASIDHTMIANIGTNTHAQIDTHISDTSIHFTQASLDHTLIANIGTNTHAQIDTHISDASIHFTQASIDHTMIANIGTNTHAQIDTHISDTLNPHSVTKTQVGLGNVTDDLQVKSSGHTMTGALVAPQVSLVTVDPILTLQDTDSLKAVVTSTIIVKDSANANVMGLSHNASTTTLNNYCTGDLVLSTDSLVANHNLTLTQSTNTFNINNLGFVDLGTAVLQNGHIKQDVIYDALTANQVVLADPLKKLTSLAVQTAFNKPFATTGNYTVDTVLQGDDIDDTVSTLENLYSASKVDELVTASTGVANTKLPLAGGTMTGVLNMGGQSIINANNVTCVSLNSYPNDTVLHIGDINTSGVDIGSNLIIGDSKTYYDTKYTIQNENIFLETPMTASNAPTPYVASQSTTFLAGFEAWRAFDGIYATQSYSQRNKYSDATGYAIIGVAAQTTLLNATVLYGEWIQLDMGNVYQMKGISYNTAAAQYIPDDYTVLGSNTAINDWVALDTVVGDALGKVVNTTYRNNFILSASYRYFRFVLQRTPIGGWGGTAGLSFRSLDIHTKALLGVLMKASVEITDDLTVNNILQDTKKDYIGKLQWQGTPYTFTGVTNNVYLHLPNGTALQSQVLLNGLTQTTNGYINMVIVEAGYFYVSGAVSFINAVKETVITVAISRNSGVEYFCAQSESSAKALINQSVACSTVSYMNVGDTISLAMKVDNIIETVSIVGWCLSLHRIPLNV